MCVCVRARACVGFHISVDGPFLGMATIKENKEKELASGNEIV